MWRLDLLRTVTVTVDMHISMLRKKLGDNSRHPAPLHTVHGIGWMRLPLAPRCERCFGSILRQRFALGLGREVHSDDSHEEDHTHGYRGVAIRERLGESAEHV